MFSDPSQNIGKLGLREGMKVVDVGAGSGFYSIEAGKRVGPSGRVYAVDVQKDLMERLRAVALGNGLQNVEVVWGNAEKVGGTKLRESIADAVVASNILFQIEKPDDFALEVKRILKPGGQLLIIDWSEASTLSPKTIVPAEKAQTLFEKNGFSLVQKWSAGNHHYGMVLKRT